MESLERGARGSSDNLLAAAVTVTSPESTTVMARSTSKTHFNEEVMATPEDFETVDGPSPDEAGAEAEVEPVSKGKVGSKQKLTTATSSTSAEAGKPTSKGGTTKPSSKQQAPARKSTAAVSSSSDVREHVHDEDEDEDRPRPKRRSEDGPSNTILRQQLSLATADATKYLDEARSLRAKLDAVTKSLVAQDNVDYMRGTIEDLEAHNAEQADAIRALKLALTGKDRLNKPGRDQLIYITAAEAREERQQVEDKVVDLKKELEDAKAELVEAKKEHDAIRESDKQRIVDLEAEAAQLRADLEVEIKLHKTQTKAGTTSQGLNGVIGDANKMTIVLYEDATNLLITDCKTDKDPETDYQQWIYQCMCTGLPGDDGEPHSISFSMRLFHNPEEPMANHGVPKLNQCKYIPKNLENESEDFRRQLDYLADPFTFHRNQMDVFFRALSDNLKARPADDDGDENGDNSMMSVDNDQVEDKGDELSIED